MTSDTRITDATALTAGLERIKHLQEQLSLQPVNTVESSRVSSAIGIEAMAYRESLDAEQAAATPDLRPARAVRPRR